MPPDLHLRQKSAWNGFVFEFADVSGDVVGEVREPRALALRFERIVSAFPTLAAGRVRVKRTALG